MKIFKRILAGTVSAAMIVSALAVPATALSSAMTHKTDGGILTMPNGTLYTYGTDTAASYTQATATLTCGRAANLYVTITAHGHVNGEPVASNTNGNSLSGSGSIGTSIDNVFIYDGVKTAGRIAYAVGKYYINSNVVATTTVD